MKRFPIGWNGVEMELLRMEKTGGLFPGRPWILLLFLLLPPLAVSGQEPASSRIPPPSLFGEACPSEDPFLPPSETARVQAERLLDEASRAQILGNREEARNLLRAAALLDPTSPEVSYPLARAEEELGDWNQARVQYCRVLRAYEDSAADTQVERGEVEMALAQVLNQLRAVPGGTPSEGLGAWRADGISGGSVERTVRPPTSPLSAFLLGLIPGAGHFHTGRTGLGWAITGVAGGALGYGALYAEREPVCMAPLSDNGTCPPNQTRTRTRRPHLAASVGVAGVVTLVSALDAARGARGRRGALAQIGGEESSLWQVQWVPTDEFSGDPTGITWMRIRF